MEDGLLIVPYGIETKIYSVLRRNGINLLIVPYGIETSENAFRLFHPELLIVPYGIETHSAIMSESTSLFF